MEALIYVNNDKYPLKRVVCKRDNGIYIMENLSLKNRINKNDKYIEYSDEDLAEAIDKASVVYDLLDVRIKNINNSIIAIKNKEFIDKTSLKIIQISGELESNLKTIDTLIAEVISLQDNKDAMFVARCENLKEDIRRFKHQVNSNEKALRRLKIKKVRERKDFDKEKASQLKILESTYNELRLVYENINKLKELEPENTFFVE